MTNNKIKEINEINIEYLKNIVSNENIKI